MKYTLNPLNEHPYPWGSYYWSFVQKEGLKYTLCTTPVSCKDYLHEAITNTVQGEIVCRYAGNIDKTNVSLDKLQLIIFMKYESFKREHLYSAKRYINTIERKNNIPLTTIKEVVSPKIANRAFVLEGDDIYIRSPALLHYMVALLRTVPRYNMNINLKNAKDFFDKPVKDSTVLNFTHQYNLFNLLMANSDRILEKTTLENIYSGKVPEDKEVSYHSGYGMVAVMRNKVAPKIYGRNIEKLLEDNNINGWR